MPLPAIWRAAFVLLLIHSADIHPIHLQLSLRNLPAANYPAVPRYTSPWSSAELSFPPLHSLHPSDLSVPKSYPFTSATSIHQPRTWSSKLTLISLGRVLKWTVAATLSIRLSRVSLVPPAVENNYLFWKGPENSSIMFNLERRWFHC
jgi:hypothetical protein